jgi:hypothetical protein
MSKLSPNKYFRVLTKIYVTLIFVQLIFILIALFLRTDMHAAPESGDFDIFKILVPLFVAGGVYEGNVLYRKRIRKASQQSTLAKKLKGYRLALMLRYAFWLAPSLFAIVAYFLTGNWMYLALSLIVILLFLAKRPGMDKARQELDL